MIASQSVENYLKAIYTLSDSGKREVNTSEIADHMETKASSVTDMFRKLASDKLVIYKKYQGVTLTKNGREIALKVIRKHRLWECFLVDKLGFKWDEVHAMAEQLEHIQSPELISRLDEFLGHPKQDPHGDPIPDEHGEIRILERIPLSDVAVGVCCTVIGVKDSSSDFLKYLALTELTLGTRIQVIERFEFDQSVKVLIEHVKQEVSLSRLVCSNLFVHQES